MAFSLGRRLAFEIPGRAISKAPFGSMALADSFDELMIERMLSVYDCVYLPKAASVGKAAIEAR